MIYNEIRDAIRFWNFVRWTFEWSFANFEELLDVRTIALRLLFIYLSQQVAGDKRTLPLKKW